MDNCSTFYQGTFATLVLAAFDNCRSGFIWWQVYAIWNNQFDIMRNRNWTKKGECANCEFYKYCQGNGMHLYDENKNLMFCHLKKLQQAN